MKLTGAMLLFIGICFYAPAFALDRPGTEFPVYQFPADAIPRIDGETNDWVQVPARYVIGTEELWDSTGKHKGIRPESLDVRVKVGWVKGTSRLYFLYEAYDDYWDFSLPGKKNDTFEVVVDGNLSGAPLIDKFRMNPEVVSRDEAFFTMHGVHAQNYHIFTPARDKPWAMLWGTQQWLKELPFANAASHYDFEPGEKGRFTLEFYITAFDHASPRGAAFSTQSDFRENQLIGLGWAVIDYDDVNTDNNSGFWNLSRSHTMFGKADELVAFRLLPPEPDHLPALQAVWTFTIVDADRRMVAFQDTSIGAVTAWHWDFGDDSTSGEQHPVHTYSEGGKYVVVLDVEGPEGRSRFSRVWDVAVP